jgi:hypothetical protein
MSGQYTAAWASRQGITEPNVFVADHEKRLVHKLKSVGFSLNVAALIARFVLDRGAA